MTGDTPGDRPAANRQSLQDGAVRLILSGTDWIEHPEAHENPVRASLGEESRTEKLIDLCDSPKVFCIDLQGRTLFPRYAFDRKGLLLPVIGEVMKLLGGRTGWQLAAWFESTSSVLDGQRPREVLQCSPERVLAAAKEHAAGRVHG